MINKLTPVGKIMTSNVITISQYAPLLKVQEIFKENRIHHIPVTESNKLIGMVSKSDYLFFLRGFEDSQKERSRLERHKVSDIMTRGIAKLAPNDKLAIALKIFEENLFHAIPIVEDEKLVGILTTLDIVKTLLELETTLSQYSEL